MSELVLYRDIYYTLYPGKVDAPLDLQPHEGETQPTVYTAADHVALMYDALGDPERFSQLSNLRAADFPIRPGHFMMFGDNSPRSKDGRGWYTQDQLDPNIPGKGWDPNLRESWEVPEKLLIGKAFFVYWPHARPFGPDIRLGRDLPHPLPTLYRTHGNDSVSSR